MALHCASSRGPDAPPPAPAASAAARSPPESARRCGGGGPCRPRCAQRARADPRSRAPRTAAQRRQRLA
eukprot:13397707-Alexandrium_andersonii.AAC.1